MVDRHTSDTLGSKTSVLGSRLLDHAQQPLCAPSELHFFESGVPPERVPFTADTCVAQVTHLVRSGCGPKMADTRYWGVPIVCHKIQDDIKNYGGSHRI